MDRQDGLIGSLVDRVSVGLPHRTGTSETTPHDDNILSVTRATLIELSKSALHTVLESLLNILEGLTHSYGSVAVQPHHVVLSETYILALGADCCSANWATLPRHGRSDPAIPTLDETLVNRLFDNFKLLLKPIPDHYILPARALLGEISHRNDTTSQSATANPQNPQDSFASPETADNYLTEFDTHIQAMVEYITASSWSSGFHYLRNVLYSIRTTIVADANAESPSAPQDAEKGALVILRLLSFFWVDATKLGLVIQEICSSYLHFSRQYQNTVAIALPLLISQWVDRDPREFAQLHVLHERLDGGVDTLFEMTQTVVDNGRRKALLYPLQTTLLFLLPDVFQVASNLREAKSNSVVKKVAFLDGLRKALRNGNEQAGYCLVTLLRAARHFDAESDSALVSYAMDVQDEVKDAVFRLSPSTSASVHFEQDMITAALVSLAHLNSGSYIESLVESCISPSAPNIFKIAVVQACCYFAQQPDAAKCQLLLDAALPFIQSQFKIEIEEAVNPERQGIGSQTDMACSILRFLQASPRLLLDELSDPKSNLEFFKPFLLCVLSLDSVVRELATAVAQDLFAEHSHTFQQLGDRHLFATQKLRRELWRLSSRILLGLCDRVANKNEFSELESLHSYLKSRVTLLRNIPNLFEVSSDALDVATVSSKLETIFLVSLCSADMDTCQMVTSCIGVFLEECSWMENYLESPKPSASILRNGDIFREVASRDFRITGLVAFQKRARALLRRMQSPTAGILNAWETAFDKWIHLAKEVSTTPLDVIDDKVLAEWRNLSGFLASLGGICVQDQSKILEEPTLGGLQWIDRVFSESYEESPLTRYLKLSLQLLACANVKVREAMRDVLSSEVSPVLYQPLFRALESELEVLLTGALAPIDKGQDSEVIFAEQAASLLRALVERLESPSDLGAASSVHLGLLTLNFAKFIDGVADGANALKVKIRICQLCEVVTRRKEHLNLRDDVRIRNQLLEYIFAWIARPRSPQMEQGSSGARHDDIHRIQRDLDKACLRSLADLTFRLPLQPSESQTDAGMSEMKSQMFHTYFNRFLSLLNHESSEGAKSESVIVSTGREELTSNADLAITILSNLLSANIDVGLKHSLSIGYHDNVDIRAAFVRVLYNILTQGMEFNSLTDSAVSEKYEELLDLLTRDLSLPVAMSAICPSAGVDELTVCLLTVFEQRGLAFDLLEALIRQEVEQTDNEAELLRRTCVATKMLSVYAKWKGSAYLRSTLQKVLERLIMTSNDLDLELDPTRVSTSEELHKNALQLQIVAKVFMDDICASTPNIPASFKKICSIISDVVMLRFPNAKYTAVGAFIFLRFFCPAIVAPEAEGIVSTAPSKEMRRGLLLIAKIIQNLANNVLFGTKEPYMFPLNPFLVQNIHLVTAFLRTISVPPQHLENRVSPDLSDFGSCVALHRYLYDHWDHLRQVLRSRGRRDYVRSPGELSRGRSPVLEPLRHLIANLGPPPLAISWNRPQIASNSPPMYSRFQNFMLRNAFRGTESFLTSRAVYDGGESKEGISIVCVILRHIESESIDYDTLLYCYLKIASRLWHEPFGLFIDATCYGGRNEPSDDFFRMLDLLAPSELALNLSRIYVYNMNSAFKRCFRRLLRISTRNDDSIFHPKNVDYHLMGSLHDLQMHFHLVQLHLPKETISVVTDTRYMFHPITRLSKSKGKIEVVIKVGSQFVQVTTAKKQEVLSGFRLSTTVNDIFRLGDVDEATTLIQADDEPTFGLRADGGKIIMFFTSPKKLDVLQTIRSAKGKLGKDSRALKSAERLVRPQDVPGTLLNLALTNLSSSDHVLRLSSYNLLGALCRTFKFGAAARLVCTRDLSVPADSARFIVNISQELANTEPHLTSDFLTEFFVSWESFPRDQKPLSLAYMSPWLSGLRTNVLSCETDSDKGREKVAVLFRKLIDLTVLDQSLTHALEHLVWPAVAQDEVLLDIFLGELMKTIPSYGNNHEHLEMLSSVLVGIGTVTMRGKVLARLRKALNRSSLRPTRQLPDNAVWNEICVLLHFCLYLSFDSGVQAQLFLPEVFHIVTMLANTGDQSVRMLVYKLLINSIHAICVSFALDDARSTKLRASLDLLCEPHGDIFFSAHFSTQDGTSESTTHDPGSSLAATESLAAILFDVCSVAAPSTDLSNAWRSRWMSLVASTAFQNNPAIQPRAFAVMGYLARQEVDDDLLYQVLVALRNSVSQFGEDGNSEMLISIVTALAKMTTNLPPTSRYGLQLFWLALSLVRLVPTSLFNCTAQFLEAVLSNIGTSSHVRGMQMVPLLLQSRSQLEEAVLPLDDAYGIQFDETHFHVAVCACLVRGLTDALTRLTAMRVLSSFLDLTTWMTGTSSSNGESQVLDGSPYLALIMARGVGHEDLKDGSWLTGAHPDDVRAMISSRGGQNIDTMDDMNLLLISAMELVDFRYLEDTAQTRTLQWLDKLAKARPAIFMHLCGAMPLILDETLLHGRDPGVLDAAHTLLGTLTSNEGFSSAMSSTNTLSEILDDMGFSGLLQSSSQGLEGSTKRECFDLTKKLIELIVI